MKAAIRIDWFTERW